MPSFPSLPALSFQVKSSTGAGVLTSQWLDAAKASIDATTDDSGSSIATNARWQSASHTTATLTDAVYFEPAASSPIAGKVVLMLAGAPAVAPNAGAMAAPDAAAVNGIYWGMWVANAGATVSRADYADWSAASPFTGTGRWTGYSRLEVGLATLQDAYFFTSAEYVVMQLMTTTATSSYICFGGAGIRGLSDSAVCGESGLGGRVFDFGVSGSGAVLSSTFWSNASSGVSLLAHSGTASNTHWYALIPGTSTIRGLFYKNNGIAAAFGDSNNNMCIGLDTTTIKPAPLAVRDSSSFYVGDHRAFFVGPRKMSKSILQDSGVNKWIAVGHSVTTQGDCLALPI